MAPLRLAVFGLGQWGERHLDAYAGMKDQAELVAVCDADQERARTIAKKYGVERSYTDFRALLESERLDAVDVVTSERSHRDIVVEAAGRGLQVFVEKPIAATLEDADAMIEAAERNNVMLLVGHILRWDNRYAMVKDMIDEGQVGKIAAISARRAFSRRGAPRYLPYITPIMQSAVHDIDLILWYTGSRVKECFSRGGRALDYKNPDTTVSILTMDDGTQVSLLNSFSLPEQVPFVTGARMEIYGSKTFVTVDATEQSLFLADETGWHAPDTTLMPVVGGALTGTLRDELSYFLRCVSDHEIPKKISPREAREALRVAIACDRSLETGTATKLF